MFKYVPIPPGKFQIRLGKNASGHASQVERSRISSSVENLNIPRGSCNVNKEDFKIDFHRRSRELFYLRPDCKTCNARAHSTRWHLILCLKCLKNIQVKSSTFLPQRYQSKDLSHFHWRKNIFSSRILQKLYDLSDVFFVVFQFVQNADSYILETFLSLIMK